MVSWRWRLEQVARWWRLELVCDVVEGGRFGQDGVSLWRLELVARCGGGFGRVVVREVVDSCA